MYIRTPKKYQRTPRRSVFPLRRILFWFVSIVLIVIGVGIYQISPMIQPEVNRVIGTAVMDIQGGIATMGAPTLTPTPDPRNDLVRANNYWDQGSVGDAVGIYMDVLPSVPNDVGIHYRVTLGLIIQGRAEEALDYAERTVTANPFSADAWAIRAWALDWNNRGGEAITSALHALELSPESARARAFLAEAYFSVGRVQSAMNTVERAIEDNPDSFEAYRARGLIQWLSQEYFDLDGALSDFQTAYSLAPNMTYIAVDMARIEISRNDYEGAIALLEDVIEVNPENTLALFWLGDVYNRYIGDPSQAAAYLNRCVDYDPNNINCFYLLGRAQDRLELYSQASESFASAIELGSTSARHYWWAGYAQLNLGNRAQCLAYLEPGYDLALEGTDSQLISDFEAILPDCRAAGGAAPLNTPVPDLSPTPEDGAAGDI